MKERKKKYLRHVIINGMKVCNICEQMKPIEQFGPDLRNPAGLNYSCKPCLVVGNKSRSRKSHLNKKYGLTIDQYNLLLESQGGICKICKLTPIESNSKDGLLAVDHCHDTNAIRGLLCTNCNLMLGFARDNITTLQAAIDYLS